MSLLIVLRKGRHQMEGNDDMLEHVHLTVCHCHRSLEFLPKILSLVSMATTVTVGGNYKYMVKYH